jgi:hypothetical protein
MSVNPEPSYHLCPDFSISPPPDGHLTLGSIIKNLKVDGVSHPLNLNSIVDIPPAEIFPQEGPHEITKFTRTLGELRSVEGSIWAKIFGPDGPGGKLSFLRKRTDNETLTVESLLTRYFIPTEEYMKKALETPGVAIFVGVTQREVPVYLITGLKVAVGAKLSKTRTKSTHAAGEASGTDPHTGTSAGASAAYKGDGTAVAGFDGSKPFVLGFRVRKIWWRRDGVRQTSDSVAGSVLEDADDDGEPSILAGLEFDDFAVSNDATIKVFEEKEDSAGVEACRWIIPDLSDSGVSSSSGYDFS